MQMHFVNTAQRINLGQNPNLKDVVHIVDLQRRQGQEATYFVRHALNGMTEPAWKMDKEQQIELLKQALDVLENLFDDWGSSVVDRRREALAEARKETPCSI